MEKFVIDFEHMFDVCDKFFDDTGIGWLLMKLFNEDTSGDNYNDYLNDFTSFVLHEYIDYYNKYRESIEEDEDNEYYYGPSTDFLLTRHSQFVSRRIMLG